jgi:hypothetical protein
MGCILLYACGGGKGPWILPPRLQETAASPAPHWRFFSYDGSMILWKRQIGRADFARQPN